MIVEIHPAFIFILVVFIVLGATLLLKLRLSPEFKFSDVFNTTPTHISETLGATIHGTEGDSARISFTFPEQGVVEESFSTASESLAKLTLQVDNIDLYPISVLAQVDPGLLRYGVSINIKIDNDIQNYLVCSSNQGDFNINSGDKVKVLNRLRFTDIKDELNQIKCELKSQSPITTVFFDQDGNLRSKVEGTLIIEPTARSLVIIYIAIWLFLVGIGISIKEVLTFSNWLAGKL